MKKNEIEIKKWLLDKGFWQAQIAREVGVSKMLVCLTIQGKERNHRVINWFLAKGCPASFFAKQEKAA